MSRGMGMRLGGWCRGMGMRLIQRHGNEAGNGV